MSSKDFNVNPTPYFTKVREKSRPPLTQTLERFLKNIEIAVIKDVRYALTGEKTPTDSGTVQTQKEDEIK
jgi:hypothetical protein